MIKGSHITQEHKRAISKKLKGRSFTEEHKKGIALSHIGKKHSEQTRQQISQVRQEILMNKSII